MYFPESSAADARHDLERRAGRVEALRRPVEQRRGGPAVGADLLDLAEVAPRRRSGCSSATRPSPGRDPCADRVRRRRRSVLPSASSAACWPFRSSVVTTVSPTIGLPFSLSSDWSTSEERLRSSRSGSALSDRSSPVRDAGGGRVADDMRRQPPLGVAAEVERPPADLLLPVPGEHARPAKGSGPRLISNCATRWIALSCRSASAGRAQVCQYVVATMSATRAPSRARRCG